MNFDEYQKGFQRLTMNILLPAQYHIYCCMVKRNVALLDGKIKMKSPNPIVLWLDEVFSTSADFQNK